MKFGVVVFPGTWSDRDCFWALKTLGWEGEYIWHEERDLKGFDLIILPGGFSYGDYLRPGAIAKFSPVMESIFEFIDKGGLVIGICNGFQILCEAKILPGALIRNRGLRYKCSWVYLRVEDNRTPFTLAFEEGEVIKIPISHYEGNYFVEDPYLVDGKIVFKYCDKEGRVLEEANPNLGMMPHPERACEDIIGSSSGRKIFDSVRLFLGEI